MTKIIIIMAMPGNNNTNINTKSSHKMQCNSLNKIFLGVDEGKLKLELNSGNLALIYICFDF